MRTSILVLTCAALTGCTAAPAPQSAPRTGSPAQPFTVPMDPGQIRCASLANPAAVDAATDWVMGLMRAQVLAGRRADMPDTLQVGSDLQSACRSTPQSTLRTAASQLGV
ncbi:hypothetical protein [Pseudooctadecabacter sp.]|uniref:hypothetical protein n=1 Tax=Pseudooctadecabacter sp. TaxID=1966338 RepID=UPI003F6D8F2E